MCASRRRKGGSWRPSPYQTHAKSHGPAKPTAIILNHSDARGELSQHSLEAEEEALALAELMHVVELKRTHKEQLSALTCKGTPASTSRYGIASVKVGTKIGATGWRERRVVV